MFDFRYHALSLVAVFLALGIGIVLGVTIGDSLVSEADRSLRKTLRRDVVDARNDKRAAEQRVRERDRLIEAAFPLIAGKRLRGTRVALVEIGSLPGDVERGVRDAIEEAGGDVDSLSQLGSPPDLAVLGRELGRRYANAHESRRVAGALGRRLARSLIRGGRRGGQLLEGLPSRFRGDYDGADAVVVWHQPSEDRSAPEQAFETELLETLVAFDRPVVGVETSDTEPSQIGFYDNHGLSSVDSVDLVGGQAALVLALDGERGRFGLKDSADEPLPRSD